MRSCGDCTLCCSLLPVPALGKKSGDRCQHARHGKGCAIYSRRPPQCRFWNCAWILDAPHIRRPDHGRYVVDTSPDFVTLGESAEQGTKVPAIQVWVDPRQPDAHRAPELRAYLATRALTERALVVVRFNSKDAIVLCPPSMSSTGEWVELSSNMQEKTHTIDQIVEAYRSFQQSEEAAS